MENPRILNSKKPRRLLVLKATLIGALFSPVLTIVAFVIMIFEVKIRGPEFSLSLFLLLKPTVEVMTALGCNPENTIWGLVIMPTVINAVPLSFMGAVVGMVILIQKQIQKRREI